MPQRRPGIGAKQCVLCCSVLSMLSLGWAGMEPPRFCSLPSHRLPIHMHSLTPHITHPRNEVYLQGVSLLFRELCCCVYPVGSVVPQIRAIVVGMSRLTSLRLDGCPKLSRSYIHRVATQLPFVMPAKDFFGFQALPDAEERIAATDIRRKQVSGGSEEGIIH